MAVNNLKLPRGAGTGGGLLGLGIAVAYGYTSRYTQVQRMSGVITYDACLGIVVDGGYRAVVFSRISGVQQLVKSEGLHFRYSISCVAACSSPKLGYRGSSGQ